jgi:hypothetical protein
MFRLVINIELHSFFLLENFSSIALDNENAALILKILSNPFKTFIFVEYKSVP